tara:strand:- start:19392 stop:20258 length:867 start_codon:yes stop_codon:yes gene_type:complete
MTKIVKNMADQISSAMETNTTKFLTPWVKSGLPHNLDGKTYTGFNVFYLWFVKYDKGFNSSTWGTIKAINNAGGAVKRGEKSTQVLFYKPHKITDKATGEDKTIPLMRYYNVFNIDQTDLDDRKFKLPKLVMDIPKIENFIKSWDVKIEHSADERCYFSPLENKIHMCLKDMFTNSESSSATENYYGTMFHEGIHSTGTDDKTGRHKQNKSTYEDYSYDFEELVAEIGSAILCSMYGLSKDVKPESVAYIKGWVKRIKDEPNIILKASAKAQRAVDWLEQCKEKSKVA